MQRSTSLETADEADKNCARHGIIATPLTVHEYLRGILRDSTPADGGTFFLDEISDLKPELEREALQRAPALAGGNRRAAAERLGIGLRALYDKLERYGLE